MTDLIPKNPTDNSAGRTLAELSDWVGGDFSGDPEKVILGAAPLESAAPEQIAFAGQPKFLKHLEESRAGAVLVPLGVTSATKNLIRVKHPQIAFSKVLTLFHPPSRMATGIHPAAVIGDAFSCGEELSVGPCAVIQEHVTVGKRVQIHPNVVIGNHVVIGDDVTIFPNVTILDRCKIGNRVVIHAGTVIGSDGYGYASDGRRHYKMLQLGIVQIDDDVEIGAGNTIDRAAFEKTWIQSGVKTDNQVHIAHNVIVGENTMIIAQTGIAGTVTIGKNAIIAGQVAIADHLTIGDRAIISGKTGIAQSVPEGAVLSGFPSMPHNVWLRVSHLLCKLPELFKQVGSLVKRVEQMENKSD